MRVGAGLGTVLGLRKPYPLGALDADALVDPTYRYLPYRLRLHLLYAT